jgi:LPS sulfotransferase NodH
MSNLCAAQFSGSKVVPSKTLVICSTGRSGSTLLGHSLNELKFLGYFTEYFHKDVIRSYVHHGNILELKAYLKRVYEKGTSDVGILGVKIHRGQWENLVRLLRYSSEFQNLSEREILEIVFPNPYCLHIRRHNITKQAVSVAIADQTDVWAVTAEGKPIQKLVIWDDQPINSSSRVAGDSEGFVSKPKFQPLKIYRAKRRFIEKNRQWEELFEKYSLPYYEIIYENFVKDFDRVIREILEFADIQSAGLDNSVKIPLKKQSNTMNDEWYKKYTAYPEYLLAIIAAFQDLCSGNVSRNALKIFNR